MAHWYTETFKDRIRFGLKVLRTLHSSRSEFQTVELFETAAMGKTLALDGLFQTSEGDEYYYHEMITHPALCCSDQVARVLVIGGGDGGTAREVLRHADVESCVMVEIDAVVVDVCKEHIPHFGAWDDPRLDLRIGDGIEFVRNAADDSFDVILLDNSDPVGPSEGLFNKEFYKQVARVLAPGGRFALQSESPILMPELWYEVQVALRESFEVVAPYFGPVLIYGCSQWSWTIGTNGATPHEPIHSRSERIETTSRYYNAEIHRGAFAVPNELKARLAGS